MNGLTRTTRWGRTKLTQFARADRQKLNHPVHFPLASVKAAYVLSRGSRWASFPAKELGGADSLHATHVAAVAAIGFHRQRGMAQFVPADQAPPVWLASNEQGGA